MAPALLACALWLVGGAAPGAEPAAARSGSPPSIETARPGGQSVAEPLLPSLVIGFSSSVLADVDLKDAKAATKLWADVIMRRKNQRVESQAEIYESEASMEAALRADLVDFVWLLPKDFLDARDRLPIVPVVISTPLKGLFNEFVLLVRRDSGIKTLHELRGKRLALEVEHDGSIPLIWLETLLMKEGEAERPRQFFASIRATRKSSQTVLPVFFGQADACIVARGAFETMAELNPQLGKELQAVATSAPFASAVGSLRKAFYDRYKGQITTSLELLHDDPQGKQILTLFRQGKLVRFEESQLATVEALLKEHQGLLLKRARRP
ncbi:MAG: PhnD/SsuA/transferrin family substrate-binding protein [Thermoanaerobaculia bacterium]|jgi:phosphonate transport system substrate-binding protein